MSRTVYRCDGCGADLRNRHDLRKEQGVVSPAWTCAACHTTVPGIVAEQIKHQSPE